VRLLFDQNLSFRLVEKLRNSFPGSKHVRDVGLASASDNEVWAYAAGHGFAIVSKDADFHQRSFLAGAPPKVVWVRRGNCPTEEIADLISARASEIGDFLRDAEATFLALS
jgi:predicted nuclease of predicted toxin-antitoxin system